MVEESDAYHAETDRGSGEETEKFMSADEEGEGKREGGRVLEEGFAESEGEERGGDAVHSSQERWERLRWPQHAHTHDGCEVRTLVRKARVRGGCSLFSNIMPRSKPKSFFAHSKALTLIPICPHVCRY